MNEVIIAGTGHYLPEKKLTNQDLESMMETSDEWIRTRTGIGARHIAAKDQTLVDMAEQAAHEALKNSQLSASDLDAIIVATCTPSHYFPSTACMLQDRLGVSTIPAFDISAACSGFVYSLNMAENFIKTGQYQHVLIVGVEAMSRLINWQDRATAVLFGDGAGAVVLSAAKRPGIVYSQLTANGRCGPLLSATITEPAEIVMDGKEVFKVAVSSVDTLVTQMLERAQLNCTDIDWLVPHQANVRIINAIAKKLSLPMEKVVLTIEQHANTSAASVPLALHHGVSRGDIKRGDLLFLVAFGAGFTCGGSIIRY